MSFTKYTQAEQVEVVSPEEHQRISAALQKVGKSSVRELSDSERESALDKSQ